MAVNLTPRDSRLPSDRTIAFAWSIVLSKPKELSVAKYIELLRQHVGPGRRADALSSRYRHLDRSSYWRSQYERVKDELKEANDSIADLRTELHKTKAQIDTARPRTATRKRKKADEDVIPVPRSPKKARRTGDVDAVANFDFTGVGEAGLTLMRSFFKVNAILTSTQKTDPTALAQHCVSAASTVAQVVRTVVSRSGATGAIDIAELKAVLTASSRAMLSLIMAFNRLSHVQGGDRVQGQVTYAYVQMFSQLTGALSQVALDSIAKVAIARSLNTVNKRRGSAKARPKQPPKEADSETTQVMSLLTTFLCDVVTHLDPKIKAHRDLFEGYSYTVLEMLGSRLYMLVFGRQRGETVKADILESIAGSVTEGGTSGPENDQIKAAALEAPFLIRLLNQIMTSAPAHFGSMMSAKTGQLEATHGQGSLKGALAVAAREKLQKTLICCMFGAAGEHSEEGLKLAQDCLDKPVMADVPLPTPEIKEAEMPEWFVEEVWKLLGWEILSKAESL